MKRTITKVILIATVFIFSLPAFSAEKIEIKVKGMVCSFCAQGIKKKFSSDDAVSKVEVNLDDKWVKLELSENKTLSDEQIRKSITDAGYNVESIERSPATETKK